MEPSQTKSFFAPNKFVLWVSLLVIFGVGLAIRLYGLTDPPLDFQPTRQLHSALMARGMYYQNLQTVPDWQRQMAVHQWKLEGLTEPPIIEHLVAFAYQLLGGVYLWVARLYSILFWILGGIALFLLVRDISGSDGAIISLVYFLVLPYAAIASRAFQPDPLLTSLIIFSFWAMNRWYRHPSWAWAIAAGALSGAAILTKSTAVFFVGGALIGLILFGKGLLKALRDPQVWVIAALAVIPYGLFYIYGIYISGQLASQFALRFFPQLWLDPAWYIRWTDQISGVVGFGWFLVGILGLLLIKDKTPRAMFMGVMLGYLAYGFTLDYHISTHDYYQLPLVPVIAIGIGVAAELLLRNLRGPRGLLYPIVVGVVLFAMTIQGWDVRTTIKKTDASTDPAFWEALGKKLGPDASVVGLTQDYGYRLEYYGWVIPDNWMTEGDMNYRSLAGATFNIDQLFKQQTNGKQYFLVTMLSELDAQAELKKLLYTGYPLLDKTNNYLLFDLRHPLPPGAVQSPAQ
ncbi:MAG: glycosyltransferase family 39 protein [Anaerolineaceae bacterium]|nr:glycosyltransferase family 39 protein [Anaerolineaceae bacterium]